MSNRNRGSKLRSRMITFMLGFVTAISTMQSALAGIDYQQKADELLPVDCLLPGAIRKLGGNMTYLTQRRPIKTTGIDCEIRGGEYVLFDRANYETALSIWLPMAENGDPKAQNYVGEIYEKGLGVEPDYKLAAQWYRKAAEQDYKAAQTNLGQMYERGLGVDYSMERALAWYRKAADIEGKVLKFVAYDYSDEQIAQMEQRLEASEKELAVHKQRIQMLAKKLDDAHARQRRAEQQLAGKKSALEKERATLSHQRKALAGQVASVQKLRTQLKAELMANASGKADQDKIRQLRNQLASSEAQLAGLQSSLGAREQQLSARELALQQKDLKLAELAAANRKLQAELDQSRQTMLAANAAGQIAGPSTDSQADEHAAPVIEMIEPPLVATRSSEQHVIVTRSGIDQRTIIGQVKSAHPILEVMVNDQSIKFDPKGMFQHRVPLTRSMTDVHVVAIDTMGKRSELAFKLQMDFAVETNLYAGDNNAEAEVVKPEIPDLDFGDYHALVIGNSQYRHLPKLNSTIEDANAVSNLLEQRYGFKVTKLIDATRYDILSALNTLRGELSEDDNLLIYYAGHGELDEVNNRGHWLPVDAEESSTANWISNVAITDILNAMSVRKVLVVADSCYSGAMTRSTLARLDAGRSPEAWTNWLKQIAEKRSRLSFSSGGLAPVLDGGGGKHSIFAKALLDALSSNNTVIEGRQLHAQVAQAVNYAAQAAQFEQTPQYAPIRFAGHESGDFLFVPR